MKKILLSLAFFLPQMLLSQGLSVYGSGGINAGVTHETMDFGGETIPYGYGSGFALHLGVQYDLKFSDIFLYSELGINWAIAYRYENLNGYTNKSAFKFNHKSASLGVGKLFRFKNASIINGVKLNAGIDFNFPSEASLTENEQYYGELYYGNSTGFHVESRLSLQITDFFLLEPGIGLNIARFRYTDYSWNLGRPGDAKLNPNASSISVFLTMRKLLKNR